MTVINMLNKKIFFIIPLPFVIVSLKRCFQLQQRKYRYYPHKYLT